MRRLGESGEIIVSDPTILSSSDSLFSTLEGVINSALEKTGISFEFTCFEFVGSKQNGLPSVRFSIEVRNGNS